MWTEGTVPSDWRPRPHGPERQSTCELEADVLVEDLQNRRRVNWTPLEEAPSTMQMALSLAPLWEDPQTK